MEPEYFYEEAQRWNFGFENPNKAAVLFACLLPFCWLAWSSSWSVRRSWLRIPVILLSGMIVLVVGGCLLMTFSRGGLVAALVAMGYFWVRLWRGSDREGRSSFWRRPAFWLSGLLLVTLICGAIWCGVAERSTEGVVGDGSVTHRLDLWKGGLRMAYDYPSGFGAGESGAAYMQWYQEPGRTEGYRTMVNSYLTFLVEQGWLMFGLSLAFLLAFWRWSAPKGGHQRLILALKASLLAFLVAGFFSTTMENLWLWVVPSLSVLGVVVLMVAAKRSPDWRTSFRDSLGITFLLLGGLWGMGWLLSSRDPLIRTYGLPEGIRTVVSVSPRNPACTIALRPDPAVLGDRYGKLVQALALGANARVDLEGAGQPDLLCDFLVATGKKCFKKIGSGIRSTIWIAPPIPSESESAMLKTSANATLLLLPEIDEDGRSGWWNAHAPPHTRIIPLDGVGTRIDWAWGKVIGTVKERCAVEKEEEKIKK